MQTIFIRFLLLLFIIGINTRFNSLLIDNLNKKSVTYAYLCEFDDSSNSKKNTVSKNCFSCILKNGDNDKKIVLQSFGNFCKNFYAFINFSNKKSLYSYSKIIFQSPRSPPLIS